MDQQDSTSDHSVTVSTFTSSTAPKRRRNSYLIYFAVVILWLLVELNSLRSQQQFSIDIERNEALVSLPRDHPHWVASTACFNCSDAGAASKSKADISLEDENGDSNVGDDDDDDESPSHTSRNSSHPSAVICSIIRDENRYLDEWTLYHLALGFEKIYIFDNSDTSAAQRWYDEHSDNSIIQKGVHVHKFQTKHDKRQLQAFRGCIKQFGKKHTWVAFYDPDEFLVLKKHDNVVDMLTHHCHNGSLGVNWVIFGTSNQTDYVDAPVTQRFQYHTGVDGHVKTIVKVEDFRGIQSAHWVKLDDAHMRRDTNGNRIRGVKFAGVFNPTYHPDGPIDTAALHHYKYRSVEEFNDKGCSRGYVWNQKRCFNQTLDDLPVGHIFDDTAWKLLQKLVPKYRKTGTTISNEINTVAVNKNKSSNLSSSTNRTEPVDAFTETMDGGAS